MLWARLLSVVYIMSPEDLLTTIANRTKNSLEELIVNLQDFREGSKLFRSDLVSTH